MKVLFICYANVGTSQVAEACFRTLSRHECASAGIAVDERIGQMKLSSKKLKHNAIQHSVDYIRHELGIDVGEKERQQLVPKMIENAELVVVIAERERWPSYLKEGGKVVFWDTADPARMGEDAADEVYREVQRRVARLVAEIG